MNWILTILALLSIVFGLCSGRMEAVGSAALQKCGEAVPLVLSLAGALCLWSGLAEIAGRAGLTEKLATLFRPLTGRLFPAFRRDSAVLGLISMNIAANLLGLGNAATPLGLAAMERMAHYDPAKVVSQEEIDREFGFTPEVLEAAGDVEIE